MEAADLGTRLCLASARSVYPPYAVALIPVLALAVASYQVAHWLPTIAIWVAKPWLDRTILFALSRAAFGQGTSPRDLWRAQRDVWWRQLVFTWTVRRLSPWRSLTQSVYQLEGLPLSQARARARQIRRPIASAALMVAGAFCMAETAIMFSLVSLVFWLAPRGTVPGALELMSGDAGHLSEIMAAAYAVAVVFVEPFYVAAGFAMYLNRRTELEAWDIEQEFRRAFAS